MNASSTSNLNPTPAQRLGAWYGALSPQSLREIGAYYAPQARFKDPFNEVQGLAAISRIFEHMFANTDGPRFVIVNTVEQGCQAFISWEFHFVLRGRAYQILGGSHVFFDAAGLVTLHRDYWDAAEELWQKLPLLGPLVRWLRRRFMV